MLHPIYELIYSHYYLGLNEEISITYKTYKSNVIDLRKIVDQKLAPGIKGYLNKKNDFSRFSRLWPSWSRNRTRNGTRYL